MPPKQARLRRKEVSDLIKTGKRFLLPGFSIFVRSSSTPLRYSVIVPMSVAKKSTDRNKLKRDVYKDSYHQLKMIPNLQVVLLLKSSNKLSQESMENIKGVLKSFSR
jgi:ribonuclease P protein component